MSKDTAAAVYTSRMAAIVKADQPNPYLQQAPHPASVCVEVHASMPRGGPSVARMQSNVWEFMRKNANADSTILANMLVASRNNNASANIMAAVMLTERGTCKGVRESTSLEKYSFNERTHGEGTQSITERPTVLLICSRARLRVYPGV